MPKKPALKMKKSATAITKKVTRTKAAPKTAKSVAKKTAKAAHGHDTTPAHKRGFMWRLLERKKAEMKEKKANADAHGHKEWESHNGGVKSSNGFARFNGPRRKAA